jgi:tetratricopeptide (TPR) repeat protein
MTTSLNSAIVRIHAPSGTVVGTGFLVTDHHVLTCAHVVTGALGLPNDTPSPLQADLHLDFPLLAPESTLTARLSHWQPAIDVAVLELTTDPPPGSKPVRLVTAADLWGHAFRAFGSPSGYEDGVWTSGVLRGRTAAGWVQVEDVKGPGYWVQPGFSGTPVWDEQLDGVVGMAVAADTDHATKAAFMIPAQELIEAWPELAARGVEAGSLEHLQVQLARIEEAQRNAADPSRFQEKIDALEERIAAWDSRVERQRERIAEGLEEQRRQMAEERARRKQERLRVVGRPPLDVNDYFKNRQRELNKLGQLLAQPTTRLVSVIGHGGMGKTALVCKVLQDLERHRWPYTNEDIPVDGVAYLSTRTAGISLERLFLDCAKLLGGEQEQRLNAIWTNPQIETKDKIDHLLGALGSGRYVILLDNLEDLLDDQGQLTDDDLRLFFNQSLTTTQGAQLVVTSRVALAFRREVMRFDRQVKLLEGLPTEEGVALLRELDPNGDYSLRDAPEEQLAEAVDLAHGVPRALEVLGGILANDPFASVGEVLETFYEQEDVVQALIEENYKRLDWDARRVIEALAVFRRPVPPLAVDYLLEPFAPGLDVPGILQRLTRTNIVSVDRAAKTITLHPIDQDYAYSQLSEESKTEANYTRQALECCAADYYVQLRTPEETWKSINDLEPQLNEFEHRVRAEDYDDACQVLNPIDSNYLYLWGHYSRLVDMREKLLGNLTSPHLRADNLGSLGRAFHVLGYVRRATNFYREARDITREIGDRRMEGVWLGDLGRTHHDLGQFERAIELHEEALAIAREIGDYRSESIWLGELGLSYRAIGQVERAIKHYEQALVIARDVGDRQEEGRYLGNLGRAYHALGQFGRAVQFLEEALAIAREIGDRREEGLQLGRLGIDYRALGRIKRSIEFHKRALAIAREIGDRRREGLWLGSLGLAYHALGRVDRAIRFHEEALAIAREIGERWAEEGRLGSLGLAYRDLGQIARAIEYYDQALSVAREIGNRQGEGIWLSNLGSAYHILGQAEQAISFYEEALAVARGTGDRRGESHCVLGLGKTLLFTGQLFEAQHRCTEALTLDMPQTSYQAALALGTILLHQRDSVAGEVFANTISRCQDMLDKAAGLYKPTYALATALVGQAVCDPRWADESQRPELLAPALTEYRHALDITSAPGIVQEAIRDLELIRAAGIEGLEPVFELLKNAEYKPDKDLPDILEEMG